MEEKINETELSNEARFLFIASMKVAIDMKKMGKERKAYLEWCSEIWSTLEINGLEKMDSLITEVMQSDIIRAKEVWSQATR